MVEYGPKDIITYCLIEKDGSKHAFYMLYVTGVSDNVITGIDLNRCHFGDYGGKLTVTLDDTCCVYSVEKSGVSEETMKDIVQQERAYPGRLMEFISPLKRTSESVTLTVKKETPIKGLDRILDKIRKRFR